MNTSTHIFGLPHHSRRGEWATWHDRTCGYSSNQHQHHKGIRISGRARLFLAIVNIQMPQTFSSVAADHFADSMGATTLLILSTHYQYPFNVTNRYALARAQRTLFARRASAGHFAVDISGRSHHTAPVPPGTRFTRVAHVAYPISMHKLCSRVLRVEWPKTRCTATRHLMWCGVFQRRPHCARGPIVPYRIRACVCVLFVRMRAQACAHARK